MPVKNISEIQNMKYYQNSYFDKKDNDELFIQEFQVLEDNIREISKILKIIQSNLIE